MMNINVFNVEESAEKVREVLKDSLLAGEPIDMDNLDHMLVAVYFLGYADGMKQVNRWHDDILPWVKTR